MAGGVLLFLRQVLTTQPRLRLSSFMILLLQPSNAEIRGGRYHTGLEKCFSDHKTTYNYLARSWEGCGGTGGLLGNLQSPMEKESGNGLGGRGGKTRCHQSQVKTTRAKM